MILESILRGNKRLSHVVWIQSWVRPCLGTGSLGQIDAEMANSIPIGDIDIVFAAIAPNISQNVGLIQGAVQTRSQEADVIKGANFTINEQNFDAMDL